MGGALNIDNDLPSTDWIKHGYWDLPTDERSLIALFGKGWRKRLSKLPSWQAAPQSLKRQNLQERRREFRIAKLRTQLDDLEARVLKHTPGGKDHDQTKHGNWSYGNPEASLKKMYADYEKLRELKIVGTEEEIREHYRTNLPQYRFVSMKEFMGQHLYPAGAINDPTEPDGSYEPQDRTDVPLSVWNKFNEIGRQKILGDVNAVEYHFWENAPEEYQGKRRTRMNYAKAMANRVAMVIEAENAALTMKQVELISPYLPADKDLTADSNKVLRRETMKKLTDQANENIANIKDSSVAVAIDSGDFLKVIQDGRFKTQFEAKESNGAYEPDIRRRFELSALDAPIDTKGKDRPVYGYLVGKELGDSIEQYGNVSVVLKDDVKRRTSWTVDDSLDLRAVPQPLTGNITADDYFKAGGYNSMGLPSPRFPRWWDKGIDPFFGYGYHEAQIHGGVKLSDIKQIQVIGANVTEEARQIDEALRAKGLDIPVTILSGES